MSEIRVYVTPEYESFRGSVPQRKIIVDGFADAKPWICYDAGPKNVTTPLIFLPPVCGKADCYYKQLLSLAVRGYRAISLEWPPYWTITEFCQALLRVMDVLHIQQAHFFGASLGGYLSLKFAEINSSCQRVASLILCNSFIDTRIFDRRNAAFFFWALPGIILKRLILGGLPTAALDVDMVESIDFMVESLELLKQPELASRLTINCAQSSCNVTKVRHLPVTLIDVFDDCALSQRAREDIRNAFPAGKRAHLKNGGNFPFLSRSSEVNMHIQIHLRQFENTPLSAKEDRF